MTRETLEMLTLALAATSLTVLLRIGGDGLSSRVFLIRARAVGLSEGLILNQNPVKRAPPRRFSYLDEEAQFRAAGRSANGAPPLLFGPGAHRRARAGNARQGWWAYTARP